MFKIIGKILLNNVKGSLLDTLLDVLIKSLSEYRRTRSTGELDFFNPKKENKNEETNKW